MIQCREIELSNNIQSRFRTKFANLFFFSSCQHASKKKAPKFKLSPKHKLHKLDNWKVAHVFMRQVGIRVRDFEPAGKLHVHMYTHTRVYTRQQSTGLRESKIYALKRCRVAGKFFCLFK